MTKLEFIDLQFNEKEDHIDVTFLKLFTFKLDKEELNKIAPNKIEKNSITFNNISENKANKKLNSLLQKGFNHLKNKLTKKHTIYIHQNSGIPLIGNIAFGLVDRNTNLIEVKPITSCNLDCIYCSVDQDKRATDFVIEEEYLSNEFKKLVEFKQNNNIEAHIASQGEPLLYEPLSNLIKNIAKLPNVTTISIDTNGILLTKAKVDELINSGLTRFNFSINAIDPKITKKIANTTYNITKILEIAEYIAKKANIIITPVILKGINEEEMPKIIEFAKKIGAELGIQNFLTYRFGRNPVKPIGFDDFFKQLKQWEKKYDIKLIKSESDFNIQKTKELPKPFKKKEIIKAQIACQGRFKSEKIAISNNRTISIPNCYKEGNVKLRITRTKHNIFIGELV